MNANKLIHLGVIISTDEDGKAAIQRVDCPQDFADHLEFEGYIPQLESDEEAVQIVRDLIADNYIESMHQDLNDGDKSLLYALLMGEGLRPISDLSTDGLIKEAIELNIL